MLQISSIRMSEGPEVKIIADKLHDALSNKTMIQDIMYNKMDEKIREKIIGSSMEYIKTFGKNIVIKFSSGIYLRNHMMMWGKWRVYDRDDYDMGLAMPPARYSYGKTAKKNIEKMQDKTSKVTTDVRQDSRVRLTMITVDKVLVQFNGPIIQFSVDNPEVKEPIKSLGPDGLSDNYDGDKVKVMLKSTSKNAEMPISTALLDQRIVCGIGNKYKSEILFLNKIYPFKKVALLAENEIKQLVLDIPKILDYGYRNKGRTRAHWNKEKTAWDTTHWVFRRSGKPCWICGTKILSEKKITNRATFWCPNCQPP